MLIRMSFFQRREMDGFDARKSVVIGATNRKSDLDAALLSRFNMVRISLCCWSFHYLSLYAPHA